MALEIPNVLAASALLYANMAATPIVSLRSSNGILAEVARLPSFSGAAGETVVYSLEQELSNDEALVFTSVANIAGGDGNTFNDIGCIAFMSPSAMAFGIPAIDTLSPNLLVALVTSTAPAPGIARIPITVFKVPTIVAKIPGEPLPFV